MSLENKNLGRFKVLRKLGSGAMGAVYQAVDEKTGKNVAIKIVDLPGRAPDETTLARFEREIKLLSQFNHKNIVKIYGSSEFEGTRFYAMELVDGKSLQQIIEANGKVPHQRVITYLTQVCDALQEIHAIGIIHRDLKPANLMVSKEGVVKLTDFGIAKDVSTVSTQLTQDNHTVGTIAYMSPEQLAGRELTRKTDLYSLGIIMYRLLTGRLPFSGDTVFEYINHRMKTKVPHPSEITPGVPKAFDRLIDELLHPDPERRPMDSLMVMQRLLDIKESIKHSVEATQVVESESAVETKVNTKSKPSVNDSITAMITGSRYDLGTGGRKSKKSKRALIRETLIGAAPYAVGLAIVAGALGYFLTPDSPETLFRKGAALAGSGKLADLDDAWRKYFTPLQEKHPNHPLVPKLAPYRDDYDRMKAEGLLGRARSLGLRAEATDAERRAVAAEKKWRELKDPVSALEDFKALRKIFQDRQQDRGWFLLAEKRILELQSAADDPKTVADLKTNVANRLKEAEEKIAAGDPAAGIKLLEDVVESYGENKSLTDEIGKAKETLTKIKSALKDASKSGK